MKIQVQSYSDAELVCIIQQNSEEAEQAFSVLYERYNQRILVYCIRVLACEEDGRDIFQETFIRFYHAIFKEHSIDNVPGYIMTIARNLCLNHKRNRKDVVACDERHHTIPAFHALEQNELLGLIGRALEYLDFEHREAFILRQYEEMSYEEISHLTGVSVTTVTNRIWRAKERIKKILAPFLRELHTIDGG